MAHNLVVVCVAVGLTLPAAAAAQGFSFTYSPQVGSFTRSDRKSVV